MTAAVVESIANPYGAVCRVCGGPDRSEIDAQLSRGGSVTQLAQQFGLSRDSLYRHLKFHLRPAMQAALKAAPTFRPSALVTRIADVADAARDARVTAYASGNARLGAQLGDAEVRALQILTERFRIDHDDAADELRDANALAGALSELMHRAPKLAEVLADLLEQRQRPALAEQVRRLAQRQEISSADH